MLYTCIPSVYLMCTYSEHSMECSTVFSICNYPITVSATKYIFFETDRLLQQLVIYLYVHQCRSHPFCNPKWKMNKLLLWIRIRSWSAELRQILIGYIFTSYKKFIGYNSFPTNFLPIPCTTIKHNLWRGLCYGCELLGVLIGSNLVKNIWLVNTSQLNNLNWIWPNYMQEWSSLPQSNGC
jgi:hypothetical protein